VRSSVPLTHVFKNLTYGDFDESDFVVSSDKKLYIRKTPMALSNLKRIKLAACYSLWEDWLDSAT
jgi:hypothetical protein